MVHCANAPPPPIYDLHGGTAGVILDDSHIPARTQLANALLLESEKIMTDCGAVMLVAATPAHWTERHQFFASHGYATTTHYMVKSDLERKPISGSVRLAADNDISEIARLGSLHRALLQKGNPVFWNEHPEADARFAAWMGMSLKLPDRSMLVSQFSSRIDGFIVLQPITPMHVLAPHDVSDMALIDDFWADVLMHVGLEAADDSATLNLITGAEAVAVERGYQSVSSKLGYGRVRSLQWHAETTCRKSFKDLQRY